MLHLAGDDFAVGIKKGGSLLSDVALLFLQKIIDGRKLPNDRLVFLILMIEHFRILEVLNKTMQSL